MNIIIVYLCKFTTKNTIIISLFIIGFRIIINHIGLFYTKTEFMLHCLFSDTFCIVLRRSRIKPFQCQDFHVKIFCRLLIVTKPRRSYSVWHSFHHLFRRFVYCLVTPVWVTHSPFLNARNIQCYHYFLLISYPHFQS